MPQRGRRAPRRAPAQPGPLSTRLALVTYALSRLPPRQLPALASYAYVISTAAERGWIDRAAWGKAGGSVVAVLSMVTGLLLSYRFSSAISKWDEGKMVWVEVRTGIRDGIRMLSIPPAQRSSPSPSSPSSTVDLGDEDTGTSSDSTPANGKGKGKSVGKGKGKGKGKSVGVGDGERDSVSERIDELSGLLVGFAIALQHHLHGTRALPQAPLSDLLPPPFLSSLKRTEARVRFADTHAGPSSDSSDPSGSSSVDSSQLAQSPSSSSDARPGVRRRSTGPATTDERDQPSSADEWELSTLRDRAEEAVAMLADAVSGTADAGADAELRQQLSQLNVPALLEPPSAPSRPRSKSNLHTPFPSNLPLALLKLMEAYVVGLAEVPPDRGGWTDAKRERGLGIIKSLSQRLGHAERLRANPPPLPLTLHLSHLLIIYLGALPLSLLCVVSGWTLILITSIAGWCLLGLEALVSEVGGVFGGSENHQPLPRLTNDILQECLETSPAFARYYRRRMVSRLGEGDDEVLELDRKCARRGDEWLPSFS